MGRGHNNSAQLAGMSGIRRRERRMDGDVFLGKRFTMKYTQRKKKIQRFLRTCRSMNHLKRNEELDLFPWTKVGDFDANIAGEATEGSSVAQKRRRRRREGEGVSVRSFLRRGRERLGGCPRRNKKWVRGGGGGLGPSYERGETNGPTHSIGWAGAPTNFSTFSRKKEMSTAGPKYNGRILFLMSKINTSMLSTT